MIPVNPALLGLQGSLSDRARNYRDEGDQSAEEAAMAIGGSAAALQSRVNSSHSRAMATQSPGWDEWFQAVREAGNGMPVSFKGAPDQEGGGPMASHQMRGFTAQPAGNVASDPNWWSQGSRSPLSRDNPAIPASLRGLIVSHQG